MKRIRQDSFGPTEVPGERLWKRRRKDPCNFFAISTERIAGRSSGAGRGQVRVRHGQ